MGRRGYSRANRTSIATKRLQEFLSELPPTNFSIQPHLLEQLAIYLNLNYIDHHGSSAPAVPKSWLQATTRCGAHALQLPRLRHVIVAAPPMNPPDPHPLNTHFLDDSTDIAEAVYQMPNASHWCFLKSDTNPKKSHPPPSIPSYRFNLLGPPLQLKGVSLGPNAPTSGLTVNYTVYRNCTRTSCWYKHASIRYECTMVDPFDAKKKKMEFANIVYYGGKFYATSLQGALAVMQVLDTRLVITAVGNGVRAVPSRPCRFFKEYMVEMKGEIVMLFLIHEKSLAVVDHVEVFRLDLDKLDWIKVEKVRGKTMFLKDKCVWVESAEFGCRDDCVFFTEGNQNIWRMYDTRTCCISSV